MFHHWIGRLTSPGWLRFAAAAGGFGWAAAFVVFVATMPGPLDAQGRPVGGDFLNFYTAGRIILDGQGKHLYDLKHQIATQRHIVGREDHDSLAAYINPPTVAVAFAPLAALPYKLSYVLCTAGLLCAFVAAMRILRPHLSGFEKHWVFAVLLSLLFYPIIRTVTGGQNTVVSLLLLAAIYAALRRDRPVAAGFYLGLLAYKPQLVLLLALLLLFRRQIGCVTVGVAVGLGHYLLGAIVCGVRWPIEMSRALSAYWPFEFQYNGATQVSWLGFCEYALPHSVFKPVGLLLTAVTVAALLWAWRRADPRSDDFGLHWAVAVCGTVLVSPHTQYYDAGLVLLAILLALNHRLRRGDPIGVGLRSALLVGFVLFPAYPIAGIIGWQPLVLLPAWTLLWLLRQIASRFPVLPADTTHNLEDYYRA